MFYIIKRFVLPLPILELDKVNVAVVLHVVFRLHIVVNGKDEFSEKVRVSILADLKYFCKTVYLFILHRWCR